MNNNVVFRRINGRIIPIKTDPNDETRAARNIYQKGGTISASLGGTAITTHGLSKHIEIASRKALVRSRAMNLAKKSSFLNLIRKGSKKIKRSKLGIAGIILGAAGGFAISHGNTVRSLQTRAIRDEKLDNLL